MLIHVLEVCVNMISIPGEKEWLKLLRQSTMKTVCDKTNISTCMPNNDTDQPEYSPV